MDNSKMEKWKMASGKFKKTKMESGGEKQKREKIERIENGNMEKQKIAN